MRLPGAQKDNNTTTNNKNNNKHILAAAGSRPTGPLGALSAGSPTPVAESAPAVGYLRYEHLGVGQKVGTQNGLPW